MQSVQCKNPDCRSTIQVPPGAIQVICYECNTWHKLDDDGTDSQSVPAAAPYSPPPTERALPGEGPALPVYAAPKAASRAEPQAAPASNEHRPGLLRTIDGISYPLHEGANLIGRRRGDILLDDNTVSRTHAVIEVSRGPSGNWRYLVQDIGHREGQASTNGVYVSGRTQRLSNEESIPISYGSIIEIGRVRLELIFPDR